MIMDYCLCLSNGNKLWKIHGFLSMKLKISRCRLIEWSHLYFDIRTVPAIYTYARPITYVI